MNPAQEYSYGKICQFMDLALKQAQKAIIQEQVPVGCVFVNCSGQVKASSHNLTNKYKNASRHCQINCIEMLNQSSIDISQLTLFVTVQPCIMCTYALNIVKIRKVYFGQYNQRFGGCGSVLNAHKFPTLGRIKQKQSLDILKNFYERGNQNIPEQMRNKSRKKIKKFTQNVDQ